MRKLWNRQTNEVFGESGMFADKDYVQLMFPARKIRRVCCPALNIEYVEGKDWCHEPESGRIVRTAESAIPFWDDAALHPPDTESRYYPDPAANAVGGGLDGRNLRFDAGDLFARNQIEIDYQAESIDYAVKLPEQTGRLPRFRERLKRPGAACRISWLGDSISEGYNASGYLHKPPFQPAFAELSAEGLREAADVKVELLNRGLNGADSSYPLSRPEIFRGDHPDLLVIAFGMNDLLCDGGTAKYLDNIAEIIRLNREVSPETEYLLATPMTGNPMRNSTKLELTAAFARSLRSFAAECPADTALADLTAVWCRFLERKNFFDLTGNGVNHPNDCGHRILASGILNVLAPDFFPFREP